MPETPAIEAHLRRSRAFDRCNHALQRLNVEVHGGEFVWNAAPITVRAGQLLALLAEELATASAEHEARLVERMDGSLELIDENERIAA